MAGKTQDEVRLNRYLLGQVSERERERTEEEFFGDDTAFEEMLAAEDDLIDAYARGEMSEEERNRFEGSFLPSPGAKERVLFARSFSSIVEDAHTKDATPKAERSSAPSWLTTLFARGATVQIAFAAILMALVVGLAWLIIERGKMREQLRQLRDERVTLDEKGRESERQLSTEKARNEELQAQLEGRQATPNQTEVGQEQTEVLADNSQTLSTSPLAFVLSPGLVRGGGAKTLTLPKNASSVVLKLNIESEVTYSTYRAHIETAGGLQIWRASSIKSSQGTRTLSLPSVSAKSLPPGDYVLLLSGQRPDGSFEDVADYTFRVIR